MKYKLQVDYLTLIIDDDFHHKTIRDIFNHLHLSKKTIHLLKQDKNYTLNNQFVNDNHLLNKNDHLKIKALVFIVAYFCRQKQTLTIISRAIQRKARTAACFAVRAFVCCK